MSTYQSSPASTWTGPHSLRSRHENPMRSNRIRSQRSLSDSTFNDTSSECPHTSSLPRPDPSPSSPRRYVDDLSGVGWETPRDPSPTRDDSFSRSGTMEGWLVSNPCLTGDPPCVGTRSVYETWGRGQPEGVEGFHVDLGRQRGRTLPEETREWRVEVE